MTNFTMLTCNRPRLTGQALRSLGVRDEMSITIRDDSTDETKDIVDSWGGDNSAYVFRPKEKVGTGTARNEVIKASEMEFGRETHLYLSDNDVRFLHPDWLKVLISAYDKAWDHGFRVVAAYNHPYHLPVSEFDCGNGFKVKEVWAVALQSMLMRWEVWDEFGPFADTPAGAVCMGEDVEFGNAIREKGYKLGVIDPPLLVNTGITNSFGQLIPGYEAVRAQAPMGVLVE